MTRIYYTLGKRDIKGGNFGVKNYILAKQKSIHLLFKETSK